MHTYIFAEIYAFLNCLYKLFTVIPATHTSAQHNGHCVELQVAKECKVSFAPSKL